MDSADVTQATEWNRLESVFLNAAALSGKERDLYLSEACGGDFAFRGGIDALLDADSIAGRAIESLIENAAQSLMFRDMGGVHLGPWRIERELGRGGMGAVYFAVRDGEHFDKQVAIKLIRPGVDANAILPRFLAERRILAGLDHPFIARLIDGGTSPDGQPYFVMEYVEGVSIREYCLRERLSTARRCGLFRKVCEAVSFAHGQLVVHRDLKPANILISSGGDPKLLDFGIARMISGSGPDESRAVSALTSALTPQYASPEQARGERVGTASDIYSLGIILGELLEDERPIPDMTAILAKATHPDAAGRYASVEQLSDDVGRFLEGFPVSARKAGWSYRAHLFITRNRAAVAGAVFAAALLAAGVISIAWEARQARLQREKAEHRLGEMVELANRALFQVHAAIDRLPGATDARREIVQSTTQYLDRLNSENGGNPGVLAALASAYESVAGVEGNPLQPNLGDIKAAADHYAKAGDILDGLLLRDPGNPELSLKRASLDADRVLLAESTGALDEATRMCRRGLEDIRNVLRTKPADLEALKTASRLRLSLIVQRMDRDPAGAQRDAETELRLEEAMVLRHPRDIDALLYLASAWTELGQTLLRQDRLEEQTAAFRKAVAANEKALSVRPGDVEAQRDLIVAYVHLGDSTGGPFNISAGDYAGAVVWYRKAAEQAAAMSASDLSNKLARFDLGVILMRIGAAESAAGAHRDALRDLARSSPMLEASITGPTLNVSNAHQFTLLQEYTARSLRALGRCEAAVAAWRRSLAICASVLKFTPTDRPCLRQTVIDYGGLASALASAGHSDGALQAAGKALSAAAVFGDSGTPSERAYTPRALAANGEVRLILAKRSPSLSTEASGFYRGAVNAWRVSGLHGFPYRMEMAAAQAGLAAAERGTNP